MSSREHTCLRCGREWHCDGCSYATEDVPECDACSTPSEAPVDDLAARVARLERLLDDTVNPLLWDDIAQGNRREADVKALAEQVARDRAAPAGTPPVDAACVLRELVARLPVCRVCEAPATRECRSVCRCTGCDAHPPHEDDPLPWAKALRDAGALVGGSAPARSDACLARAVRRG